jgi:(p)ppGpp synthase/HD superfamily hydrolase
MITRRFVDALAVAIDAHKDQLRTGTAIPYISHPLAVASIALEFGADEDQAIAALLHDAIEDGGASFIPIIETKFGTRVASIVASCTDGVADNNGKKVNWWERKRAYLAHIEDAAPDVLLVLGSDKLHNARAIVSDLQKEGISVFERFSTKREGTLWYYSELSAIFQKRRAPMAEALKTTVLKMKRLAAK